MAYPFSIARAVKSFGDKTVVVGRLSEEPRFLYTDAGECIAIDTKTLTFNTGLFDHDDNEIFTGDILRHFSDAMKQTRLVEAEFLVNEGAFFIKHVESQSFYKQQYSSVKGDKVDRTDIVHERLDHIVAQQYRIVGNIYNGVCEIINSEDFEKVFHNDD